MLRLLEGGFGSVCHAELIKRIENSVSHGKRTFLFVPEQQTLSCEAEMWSVLAPQAAQIFEVTNFTRFANTAFRSLGGIGGTYCTGAESSLIMWRVLSELCEKLNMTGGRRPISASLVDRALSVVKEMQGHGISPEIIEAISVSEKIKDRRLKAKLSDLSLIYGTYRSYVSEKYNDLAEDTEELVRRLEANPEFLSGADIYVDGFISFTEPQYKLLSVLMKCTEVTVTLTLPKARRDAFEYSEVKKTEERLKKIAQQEWGFALIPDKKDEHDQSFCEALSRVADLLFSTTGKIDNESLREIQKQGGRVRVFEAHDPFDECDFVAADIKRRVMAGESYSSFAIIARDAKKYVGILDESLSEAGIPHFISKKRDITSFEAIKLINVAYQIITRGFQKEDVLTYAKCGLTDISHSECDQFELYVTTWNIEGDSFTSDEVWRMNPRGYKKMNERDLLFLEEIDRTREKIIEPLISFRDNVKKAKTVEDHARALFYFLDEIELEKKLYERAKELLSLGESESAEENARLWQTICKLLDTLYNVLGKVDVDAESFVGLLGVLFKEEGISRLPLSRDQVTVGSADTLRMRDKRHVYLIGVNLGEFPGNVTDVSYFTEKDKEALKEYFSDSEASKGFEAIGSPIEPEIEIKSARELYCFTRAFLSAKQTVTLLYTALSASMEALYPSEVIARLGEISTVTINEAKTVIIPVTKLDDSKEIHTVDRIYSPNDALMLASRLTDEEYGIVREVLCGIGLSEIVRVAEGNILNDSLSISDGVTSLIYDGEIYVSQSRLDKFRECPCAHTASYIFGLNTNEQSEFSANIIGNFIHKVLEKFFTAVTKSKREITSLSAEEKEKIAFDASVDYVDGILGGGFGSARRQNTITQLRRAAMPVVECVVREFGSCKFKPKFFELSTYGASEDSADPLSIVIDGKTTVKIAGRVDRVDTFKADKDKNVYVRVLDYKSGSKEFDSRKLKEGENLQMFLYLKSIIDTTDKDFLGSMGVEDGGRLIPAGVIYVKTSMKDKELSSPFIDDTETVISELNERQGMLLDDPKNIDAMSEDYLPKKAEKTGAAHRYDGSGWISLCQDVEQAVRNLVSGMKSGSSSATPLKTGKFGSCTFCPYKPICRSPKLN